MYHDQVVVDSANQDKDISVESSPDSTRGINRRDVFKSCLEFTELSAQSVSDDTNSKSPLSPLMDDDKPEEGNLEITRQDDELSPHDSGDLISVSLPELQVEAATHERNSLDTDLNSSDWMHVQFVSSNPESSKQVENTNNGEKSPESDASKSKHVEPQTARAVEYTKFNILTRTEISLCGKLLQAGMGSSAAEDIFNANRISMDEFRLFGTSIVKNKDLIVRLQGKYLPWDKAAHLILGMAVFALDLPIEVQDAIPVEREKPKVKEDESPTSSRRWWLWPIPFRRVKTLEHRDSNSSNKEGFVGSDSVSQSQESVTTPKAHGSAESPRKQIIRTNVPNSDQIASLNLQEGHNMVNLYRLAWNPKG